MRSARNQSDIARERVHRQRGTAVGRSGQEVNRQSNDHKHVLVRSERHTSNERQRDKVRGAHERHTKRAR